MIGHNDEMTDEQEQEQAAISTAEAQRKAENGEFQTQLGKLRGGARPGASRKPK